MATPLELKAATSSSLDVLPAERAGDAGDSVDIGNLRPLAQPAREPAKALPSGNPLWAVPLSALTATVDRPIFSVSRRPPQRAVVAPAAVPVAAAPPPPAEPEHPALSLIGAVVGDGDAFAVFIDRMTQKAIRLRQGDTHQGWQLSAVQPREVTLVKSGRSEVIALQRQDAPATSQVSSGGVPRQIGGTPLVNPALPPVPVAGAADGSYAPFVPRSTPKNGESDGL
ncbi:hypothetical protein IC762_25000 [Bradyrhizobium genosp. L]|nr:hypothetical protein IC762_25000 [Bradyrhizobium genosp. L]